MIKQAIIPLAGLGTRLLPLTSVIPKELLPINGKPNLEYILDECIDAGMRLYFYNIQRKILKNIFLMINFIKILSERKMIKILLIVLKLKNIKNDKICLSKQTQRYR